MSPELAKALERLGPARCLLENDRAHRHPGRPVYRALVAGGRLDGGIACDDGAAAHFADDELAEIVTDSPGLAGYRVQPDGTGGVSEQRLPGRLLARAN